MELLLQIPFYGWLVLGIFIGAFMGVFLMGALAAGGRADDQTAYLFKIKELTDQVKKAESSLWDKEEDLAKAEGTIKYLQAIIDGKVTV